MSTIHPTALVARGATLGTHVTIGAYSVIDADVVIGEHTWVGSHVVIRGHTTIGQHTNIYQFNSLGEAPQHQAYDGEPTRLVLGDRNTIREYCTINRGTSSGLGVTQLGDDNFIMAYSHIAHDCRLGNHIIFANGASLAGHVTIGDYAILGGFTLVHQHCKLGQHCITGIGSVCLQEVPPYLMASGNPAVPFGLNIKGLRRRNFSPATIRALKAAYRLVYRRNLGLAAAITEIEKMPELGPELIAFCNFLRHSVRGIIRNAAPCPPGK